MEADLGTDSHVEHYRSLRPFQFNTLQRLNLQQEEDFLMLCLELKHKAEASHLMLTFEGVINLKFLPNNFQPVPLYLEIIWIGDRQWQGLNYQIFNTEQDVTLSFYCRNFQADVQTALRTDQEYQAEFELLMQELDRLNERMNEDNTNTSRAATERLKAETKQLRDETRAMLVSMGANL